VPEARDRSPSGTIRQRTTRRVASVTGWVPVTGETVEVSSEITGQLAPGADHPIGRDQST
jgi:hypothetical protein